MSTISLPDRSYPLAAAHPGSPLPSRTAHAALRAAQVALGLGISGFVVALLPGVSLLWWGPMGCAWLAAAAVLGVVAHRPTHAARWGASCLTGAYLIVLTLHALYGIEMTLSVPDGIALAGIIALSGTLAGAAGHRAWERRRQAEGGCASA